MVDQRDSLIKQTPTGELTYYRTYSRRKQDGQREYFDEMVERCVKGLQELGNLTGSEAELLRSRILLGHTFFSGRWLWVGGTDWIKKPENFSGGYNCFTGDTEILTRHQGVVSIDEILGQKVSVLNRNRKWSQVTFQEYGEQNIYNLTVRRGRYSGLTKTIKVTGDHDWIEADGGLKIRTDQLTVGSELKFMTADVDTESYPYRLGVRHGIVYGDGSVRGSKGGDRERFKVRLCGDKGELIEHFGEEWMDFHAVRCPSYNGDTVVMIDELGGFSDFVDKANLKSLPCTLNSSYLLGFVRGLIATDGSVCRQSSPVTEIYGDHQTVEYLKRILPIAGLEPQNLRKIRGKGHATNYGVRNKALYGLTIYAGSLSQQDFLRTKHRELFGNGPEIYPHWRVVSVEQTPLVESVYCCEEEETHTFTLAGGLLTGNCTSSNFDHPEVFGLMMDLAMQGSGTGAVLERRYTDKLPSVSKKLFVKVINKPGDIPESDRYENTEIKPFGTPYPHRSGLILKPINMIVGDSRQGWVSAYQELINFAFSDEENIEGYFVSVNVGHVRTKGEKLKGFGGVANPVKLPGMFGKIAKVLNKAFDESKRQLSALEICLIIDIAANVVVAGNVRRSAGMRQFDELDENGNPSIYKANLWIEDPETGEWKIDPDRDPLRMANHTRVWHHKPSLETVTEAVRMQFQCGEGAIQYAPEAERRAGAEGRYGLNPCGW